MNFRSAYIQLGLSCYLCFASACNYNKTYYVNPIRLIEGYHGAAIKRQTFLNQTKIWQANLDSLIIELSTLSPDKAEQKKQEFYQYRQIIQRKAQAEETRLNRETIDEINTYIKQYGKEYNYDFILGATEAGNIVYAAESTDLTEKILAGLNKQYDQRKQPSK